MKKFLFFVLIIAMFYFTIEHNDAHINKEEPLLQGIRIPKWPSIKRGLDKLWNEVKRDARKANQFLKDHGIYDVALSLIKILGKEAAANICSQHLPSQVCREMIDVVAKNI